MPKPKAGMTGLEGVGGVEGKQHRCSTPARTPQLIEHTAIIIIIIVTQD
jgi:hypothetical protein